MAGVKADVSPSDRLRLAAGKGDIRSVSDLLAQGINSDTDKVADLVFLSWTLLDHIVHNLSILPIYGDLLDIFH